MKQSDNEKERRKYQRVAVESTPSSFSVEVVGFGPVQIFDMSYSGAAITQPKGKKIDNPDEKVQLLIKTSANQAQIEGHVVRLTGDVVALHFSEISVSARLIIDQVVTDRMIGLNMNFIEPKHYSPKSDFTDWFHGPKETNLYLWWAQGQLLKAQFELDSAVVLLEQNTLTFENKSLKDNKVQVLNNQQIGQKALAIIEQIKKDYPPLNQFKKILREHVQP